MYLLPTLTSPMGARSARAGLSSPAQARAGRARQGQGRWPPYGDRGRQVALCLEWGHKWGHLRLVRARTQLGKPRGGGPGREREGAGLALEHRPRPMTGTGAIGRAEEVQAERTVPALHPDARPKAGSPGLPSLFLSDTVFLPGRWSGRASLSCPENTANPKGWATVHMLLLFL